MRINEAKKPSNVNLKVNARKVVNQYITGDIYDFHSPMESKEDTYVDHNGNGYIMDKTGREYPVSAAISQGDAGRIAGGSTSYCVTIYFPGVVGKDGKEAFYSVKGYTAIFSKGDNTSCVSDIQNGYYLEDYIAKYNSHDHNLPQDLYDELVSRADANAVSYDAQKKAKAGEKQAAFDKQYKGLSSKGIECEIKNGEVIAKNLQYYNDETSSYDEYAAPKNIIDKAVALFEINGYTFKDFEGATFIAKPDKDYNLDIRFDTKTGEIIAFEKHGSRMSKVDFDRVSARIENIKIDKTSPFGKLIMKTVSDKAGTQSAFITTVNIAKQINKIWGRGSSWGTHTGYSDTAFSLGTPESEMRHIRANVKRHAIEELKAEFAKMKNPDSFTYEALKEVINLLPKKEFANSAVEKPAETTTTEFKANPVAVQKMTAWHNGERKQNVGACSDAKLKMYYNTCKNLGFETEMNVLKAEAESRGLLLESKKSRRRNEAYSANNRRLNERFSSVEEERDAVEKFCILMDWEIKPEDVLHCVKNSDNTFTLQTENGDQFTYDPVKDCLRESQKRSVLAAKNRRRNEAWEYSSGRVPNDGNGRVGGSWSSAHNSGEYEKEVEVEYNSEYYLVYLSVDAELYYENDESTNWCEYGVDIDEDSISLVDIQREDPERRDVVDPQTRDILFDLAKDRLIAEKDKFFEDDWVGDEDY